MHRYARLALWIALVARFVLLARSARAEPLPIDLTWDAPPECPSHDEVMAELSRITRVKPGRVVTPISAQAKIERAADGRYRLRLRTEREDQTGDTDLDATSCVVLKRGVTLVLALALGDGVDLVDEKAAPAVESQPAAPAPPAPAPPIVRTPSARRAQAANEGNERGPVRWSAWLAATSAWGLNGDPSFGSQIGLEIAKTYVQAMARASYFFPAAADRVGGIGSSYSAFVGALGACARAPINAASLSACADFQVGAVHGSANGAYHDDASSAPWYAVGPALVLEAPLFARMKLHLAASLGVGLNRPRFAIRGGVSDVYTVSRYVPAVAVGVGFF